jgi:hypothetical protein
VKGASPDNGRSAVELLVFLHLPKTAGSTLLAILERNYGSDRVLGFYESTYGEEARRLTPGEIARTKVIAGHFYLGVHEFVAAPCRYLTFLRDPVARVVSHYEFARRQPEHYLHEAATKLSLSDYVRLCGDHEPNNDQTRLLAGREMANDDGTCSPAMLPVAKRNLDECVVIGLTEKFDESLVLMRHVFGWRQPFYVPRNVNRSDAPGQDVPPEARAVVEKFNALDIDLYGYGCDRFDRLVGEQGPGFAREVRMFERLNALYRTASRLRSLPRGRPIARRG